MTRNPTKDLSNTFTMKQWTRMLEQGQTLLDQNFFANYPRSGEFVKEMIRKTNEDRPIWSPTVSQWNYLHSLVNQQMRRA